MKKQSRTRHVLLGAVGALAFMAWAPQVHAQSASNSTSFQVEHFEPLPSQGANILNIGTTDVLPDMAPSAGVFFHYVDSPLRLVDAEDSEDLQSTIIKNQGKLELWGSVGLFDIAEIGFVLPMVAFQSGEDLGVFGRPGETIDGFALADVRFVPKVRVPIEREKLAGFGVGLVAPVYVPIGDSDSFNSDGGLRVEPRLLADWQHEVGITVSGNLGYQLRPEQQARNIVSDDVLRYGLGVELPTGVKNFQIIGSFFGNIPTAGDPDPAALGEELENKSNPREALGGVQYQLPYNLVAQAGAGAGLSSGVGSPRFRVFASIGYTPQVTDSDGDGLLDEDDGCPKDAEDFDQFQDSDGCPDLDNDNDKVLDADDECPMDAEDMDQFEDEDGCPDPDNDQDGILDADDRCPTEAGVAKKQGCPFNDKDGDEIEDKDDACPEKPEDKDGFKDEDGCPDIDNDQDGVLDKDDKCPMDAEDKDGFEDSDGCPDPDNDKDGIPDEKDKCPTEAETYNGNKDEDGCPDGKQTVVITKTEIKILQKVFFASGKATIQRRSYKLLDTVAGVLKQNPQVTKLRVEGHTDDVGKDASNLKLSKERAAAVKSYLVDKGVEAERLESEGYGETRPLCKDMDELLENKRKNRRKIKSCRADNRRVEFKILEVNGKPVEADDSVTIEKKKVVEEPVE